MFKKRKFINQLLQSWGNRIFLLLGVVMFLYYGYRMFELTPWYDELYTYYFFVSRGPLYAAIHWPVPNNHVGYSVLSGFLDLFGNAAIGLRGVSLLSALANLYLIHRIAKRHLSTPWAFGAVFIYLSMGLVNQLAVQGRGYTLGTTCCLLAVWMVDQIIADAAIKKSNYFIFAVSLTAGLYVLPSSVYWVLPLCFSGGVSLLCACIRAHSDRKRACAETTHGSGVQEPADEGSVSVKNDSRARLLGLIFSAAAAAVMTVGLYTVIWLAIGSNLLVKDSASVFFGQSHVSVILSAPLQAAATGIQYMLSTPYIQSVQGDDFLSAFYDWCITLFDYLLSGFSFTILIVLLTGCMGLTVSLFSKNHLPIPGASGRSVTIGQWFFKLYLLSAVLVTPIILIIQRVLPYHRVFSYLGAPLALLTAWLLQETCIRCLTTNRRRRKRKSQAPSDALKEEKRAKSVLTAFNIIITGVLLLFAMFRLFSSDYLGQYGVREHALRDALEHSDFMQAASPAVTDCTQQYMIKYLYGVECENQTIEGSDFLLLDKKMTDSEYDIFEWEFYHTYDTISWEYVNFNLTKTYENDIFIVYEKDEKKT